MSKAGHVQNLSFYGDIVARVFTRPQVGGYEWLWHPASSLTERNLRIGPVIAPRHGPDLGKRKDGQDGAVARPDLLLKFIKLEPTLSEFRKFADSYGLLGLRSIPLLGRGDEVRSSEPLVLWLQHHFRLNQLYTLLLSPEPFDREEFFRSQELRSEMYLSNFRQAATRLSFIDLDALMPDLSGANIGHFFQTVTPTLPKTLRDYEVQKAAYENLTKALGRHCRIAVRFKSKTQSFNLPRSIEDKTKSMLITTNLEPKGLLGFFYISILLHLSASEIVANSKSACAICGAPIPNHRSNKIYCDDRCRQKARRQKAKTEVSQEPKNV